MVAGFGIAGSSPLQDHSKHVNVLLRDWVAAHWADNGYTAVPATDIDFGTVWWNDSGDIDIIFLPLTAVELRRSTDWSLTNWQFPVSVHIFVREMGDEEPDTLHKVESRLQQLLEINKTSIIPYSVVKLTSFAPVPDFQDNLEDIWHSAATVMVYYSTVVTS